MLNINLGGAKGFNKFSKEIQNQWKIMDSHPNADYVYNINSGKIINISSNTVDNYYCSHTLEHALPSKIDTVLKELYRTLKVGGTLRIVVPDITVGIQRYLSKKPHTRIYPYKPEYYPDTSLGFLMCWFHTEKNTKYGDGHNIAFDWQTLCHYLKKAGFKKINRKIYNDCSDIFKGKDFERYIEWSLYVEVTK